MNEFYTKVTVERVDKINIKNVNQSFKHDWETKKWKYKSCFSFVWDTKDNEFQMLYDKIILTTD